MNEQFGPLECCCDAPPYGIVRGCHLIGLKNPEDVAWHRLSHPPKGRQGLFRPQDRKMQGKTKETATECCTCGRALPALETYDFTLVGGGEVRYLLGQCAHCHTILWDEIPSAST